MNGVMMQCFHWHTPLTERSGARWSVARPSLQRQESPQSGYRQPIRVQRVPPMLATASTTSTIWESLTNKVRSGQATARDWGATITPQASGASSATFFKMISPTRRLEGSRV
jgi:hypothetical protein